MNQLQITQQKENVEQLQARLISMEDHIIDLKAFQAQSLEVNSKIEIDFQDRNCLELLSRSR